MTPQEKLDLFWEKYKIYSIDPNRLFTHSDKISGFIQSQKEIFKVIFPLGIAYAPNLTFGKIFQLIGITIEHNEGV